MAYDENPNSIWGEFRGFLFHPITTYGRWLMYRERSIEDGFPLKRKEQAAYGRLIIVSAVLSIVLIAAIVALGIFVLPLIAPVVFGAGLGGVFAASVSLFAFTVYVSLPAFDFVANKIYEFVSNIYSALQTGVNKLLSLFKAESDAVAAESDSVRARSDSHHSPPLLSISASESRSNSVSVQSLIPDSSSSSSDSGGSTEESSSDRSRSGSNLSASSSSDSGGSTEESSSDRSRSGSNLSESSFSISESASASAQSAEEENVAQVQASSVQGSDRASSFPARQPSGSALAHAPEASMSRRSSYSLSVSTSVSAAKSDNSDVAVAVDARPRRASLPPVLRASAVRQPIDILPEPDPVPAHALPVPRPDRASSVSQPDGAAAEDAARPDQGGSDPASSFPASLNAALEPVQGSASGSDNSAEKNSSVRGRSDRAPSLSVSSLNATQPSVAVSVEGEGAATGIEIQSDDEDADPAEPISIALLPTNKRNEFINVILTAYYSSEKKESSPESNTNFRDNENLRNTLAKLQELLTRMSGYAKELIPVKTVTKEISERFVDELDKNRPFGHRISNLDNYTLEDAAKVFSAYNEAEVPFGIGKVPVGVLLQYASRFLNTLEKLIVYVEETFSTLNLDDRNTNTPLITIINEITAFFQIVTRDKLRDALVQATASSIPASGLALLLSFHYDGNNKSTDKVHHDKYKKHKNNLHKLASHFAVTIQELAESIHKEFSKFVDDFLETEEDNYSAYRTNITVNFKDIKQFQQKPADQIDTKNLIVWLINTLAINNQDEKKFFKTFFQQNDLMPAYLEKLKRVIAISLTHDRGEGKITSFLREMHFLHKLHYTIYQEQAQKKSVAEKFDFLQSLARPLILLRRLNVLLDNVNKEADQKLREGFTTYFDKTKQAHSKPNNDFDNTLDHGFISTIRKLKGVLKSEADKTPNMYDNRAAFQNKVVEILHNNFFMRLGVDSNFLPEELKSLYTQMMETIDSSLKLDALKSEIKGNHSSEELTKLLSACTNYMEKAEQFVSTKHQKTIDTILSGLFSMQIETSSEVPVETISNMLLNYFCKAIYSAFNIVIAESRPILDVDKFKSALQIGCDQDEVNDSMRLLKEKIESYADSRLHSEDDTASISTTFRNDFVRLSTHFFKIMEFRVKPTHSHHLQLRKVPVTNGIFSEKPQPNGTLQQSEQPNDGLRA